MIKEMFTLNTTLSFSFPDCIHLETDCSSQNLLFSQGLPGKIFSIEPLAKGSIDITLIKKAVPIPNHLRSPMQFGAMNFPVTPVLDEIDTFSKLGFDYLELTMDAPMAHHSVLSSNKASITRALKDSGLGLVCHLPTFLSTADLTESLRRASIMEMHESLDMAMELGAKKVVLHPSMVAGMGPFVLDTIKGYAFDFLSEMVTAAQQMDMTICLENMFPRNMLGVEPDDFEEIFMSFPTLKLTLDTGHANIDDRRGKRLKEFVNRFGERIGHLHFSDNNGKFDGHLAVGKGTVNFTKLVRHLKTTGYDDTLTLEVFDTDRQNLVASRERIKSFFS